MHPVQHTRGGYPSLKARGKYRPHQADELLSVRVSLEPHLCLKKTGGGCFQNSPFILGNRYKTKSDIIFSENSYTHARIFTKSLKSGG